MRILHCTDGTEARSSVAARDARGRTRVRFLLAGGQLGVDGGVDAGTAAHQDGAGQEPSPVPVPLFSSLGSLKSLPRSHVHHPKHATWPSLERRCSRQGVQCRSMWHSYGSTEPHCGPCRQGNATCLVHATGDATFLGKIAQGWVTDVWAFSKLFHSASRHPRWLVRNQVVEGEIDS